MKILLFGKSGQLGWELQRSLSVLGELVALDSRSLDLCGDFKNMEGISQTIRTVEPDIIVNAVAYTAVDQAEGDFENAHLINATAPSLLAQEAKRIGAWLIHYSTDYVFDGSGHNPWVETDATGPLNIYGKTKLAGENLIRDSGCQHLIFRTSWVYAARGKNFVKTILKLAQERDSLSVINDQIGAPTGADLLADITAHAICNAQRNSKLSGLYHVASAGETSWYDYACFVLDAAYHAGLQLKVTSDKIQAVQSSAFPTPASRPKNSRLNTHQLQSSFTLGLPPWQNGVKRLLAEILEKPL